MEENALMVASQELSVTDVTRQVTKIQELMSTHMKEGEHYGVIPGTQGKPSLLKAGAEKLCFIFRLAPEFEITQKDLPNGHREYSIKCTLRNMATGGIVGSGVGCCTTMESKYRYRNSSRKCPRCGQETIIKGKEEYGGGWVCFAKKGGCNTKFAEDDPAITGQHAGKVDNPDIADVYNTVLKMAKKRAHVDATITACAASDIFTQDIEDFAPVPQPEPAQPAAESPRPVSNTLHDRIGAVRAEFVNIMQDPAFSDEDRTKAKAKIEVGKGTTQEYLDYCKTVVDEYEKKLRDKKNIIIPPGVFEDDIPGEVKKPKPQAVSGQDIAKKFGVEIPKDELF